MARTLGQPPVGSGLKAVRGPRSNAMLQTIRMRHDLRGQAAKLRAVYGDLTYLKLFVLDTVYAQGPAAAEVVLTNWDRAYANAPSWGFFMGPFFSRGLLTLDFDEHLGHKRILQQAFTPTSLKGYMDRLVPRIEASVDQWAEPDSVRIYELFKKLTLDVALEVFVGVELDDAEEARINRAFIDSVRATSALVRKPIPGFRWKKGLAARKVLEDFFRGRIPETRRDGGTDLFAVMCGLETEDGAKFSDDDIVNHMIFVLMAAHDTSTQTLATMAYYLAKNPEWQEKVRQESIDLGPHLAYDRLSGLECLDWCMKESLRLCAPVPGMPRMTVRDTELLGHHIPKGTTVIVPTYTNHYIDEYWPDPTAFDPGRFSPERRDDKIHRMAWAPFGGGVHKCIGLYFGGMEVKTIFHTLLQRFEWSGPRDYEWPLDISSMPLPKDGLPVTLRRIGR